MAPWNRLPVAHANSAQMYSTGMLWMKPVRLPFHAGSSTNAGYSSLDVLTPFNMESI